MTSDKQQRVILIVDDDDQLRRALCRALQEAGWMTQGCANGRAALDWLATGLRPSVILLDQDMPVMNGQLFLEAMRAEPEFASLAVIRMSGRDWPWEKTPFLEKPFQLNALIAAIERELMRKSI